VTQRGVEKRFGIEKTLVKKENLLVNKKQNIIIQTKQKFPRINARKLFLIYSEVDSSTSHAEILKALQSNFPNIIKYYLISQVNPELCENKALLYFHVYLEFNRKINITSQVRLQLKIYDHVLTGHSQPSISLKDFVKYIRQTDPKPLSNLLFHNDGNLIEANSWDEVVYYVENNQLDEAIALCTINFPSYYIHRGHSQDSLVAFVSKENSKFVDLKTVPLKKPPLT